MLIISAHLIEFKLISSRLSNNSVMLLVFEQLFVLFALVFRFLVVHD